MLVHLAFKVILYLIYDNTFLIKTYGACTNGYSLFVEKDVTIVGKYKYMLMYGWINATSHLYGRLEIKKKYFDINDHLVIYFEYYTNIEVYFIVNY